MNLKSELEKIDQAKYDLLKQGYAFDLAIFDKDGVPYHTAVGSAGELSLLSIISLIDLFKYGGDGDGFEDFAESVKQRLIQFYQEHRDFFVPVGSEVN